MNKSIKKGSTKSKKPKAAYTHTSGMRVPSTKQDAMLMNKTKGMAVYGYLEDKLYVPIKDSDMLAATKGVGMEAKESGRKNSIKRKSPKKKRGFSMTRV